ncbi:MAG: MFS transporter [Candidatus Acidiferrales bacterium]
MVELLPRRPGKLEAVCVSRHADGHDELHFPRHAGPVPDASSAAAPFQPAPDLRYYRDFHDRRHAGGIAFGLYSDCRGRRRAMVTAVLAALVLVPLWIFAPGIALITAGAFLMQFMVQGAWGVIPAHINELSPDRLRGFFPGFAYQLGVLIASTAPFLEAELSKNFGYANAMGAFGAATLLVTATVIFAGPEAHRVAFGIRSAEQGSGPSAEP